MMFNVLAFDRNIINQKTVFKWDKKDKGLSIWNNDQTPRTWLTNSVVWVSRDITSKLGMNEIKRYLDLFQYGNQNFTGDIEKNNGLTHAWLGSSLKISANEQLQFLKRFFSDYLPVAKQAIEYTRDNMFIALSPHGWKLYGKTGSGYSDQNLPEGWFVGYTEKEKKRFVFVTNFICIQPPKKDSNVSGQGIVAKRLTFEMLSDILHF